MLLIYSIEDDEGILELLECAIKSSNMDFLGFEKYEQFNKALLKQTPDLILLDIMLPNMNGISILKSLKGNSNYATIPIIMLSAKSKETDKVLALEYGADDYISKPFGVFELIARIKAVLRRNTAFLDKSDNNIIKSNGIELNIEKHNVIYLNNNIDLTYKEFLLLEYLMKNKNIALSREKLLENVWGYDYSGETRTVDMHIKSLRKKLNDDEKPKIISTIRGLGYKFLSSNE